MLDFLYDVIKLRMVVGLIALAIIASCSTLLTVCGYGPGGSKRSNSSARLAEPPPAGWNSIDDAVAAAQRRYDARIAAKPIPLNPKPKELNLASAELDVWAGQESQQLLRLINWTVRCVKFAGEGQAPEAVKLVKVNTITGMDVGPEFTVFIPRESQTPLRLVPNGWFRMMGMLEPTLLVTRTSAVAGLPQGHTSLGPYCELVFWITPHQVTKVHQPAGNRG